MSDFPGKYKSKNQQSAEQGAKIVEERAFTIFVMLLEQQESAQLVRKTTYELAKRAWKYALEFTVCTAEDVIKLVNDATDNHGLGAK